jgi:rod shape-determining protein MreD
MAEHSYTSRAELDQYAFRPVVTILAPLLLILLQAMLPKTWSKFNYMDLPLIAVIFFSVARRNPITGTITGTLIGLLQDGLTSHPFGVFGIAKGVIGYVAASIGFAVDVDNAISRVLLNFGFSLVQSGLLYLISRRLLANPSVHLQPVHQLICATVNAVVALPVFMLLDRFKLRE